MRMSMIRRALAGALSLSLCTLAMAAERATEFKVGAAQVQALGIQFTALGKAEAALQASYPAQVVAGSTGERMLSAPAAAMVSEVLVQAFQEVKAGAPLLRLASPELGQWQLQAIQASSRAQLARQQAQREQTLFDEGIIAARRLQEAKAAEREAEAALQQASATLRLAGMDGAALAALLRSGQPQDSLLLRAPRGGTVGAIDLRPGQRVEAGAPLLSIASGALALDIQVPLGAQASWPAGTPVQISGREAQARLTGTAPGVTPGSQSLMLRAVFDKPVPGLRAGEMLSVSLPVGQAGSGWTLPLSAVAHEGKQAYVFVRTKDGFSARAVTLSASAGQQVQVQGTLKAGEQVAHSGVVALKGAWQAARGE